MEWRIEYNLKRVKQGILQPNLMSKLDIFGLTYTAVN